MGKNDITRTFKQPMLEYVILKNSKNSEYVKDQKVSLNQDIAKTFGQIGLVKYVESDFAKEGE